MQYYSYNEDMQRGTYDFPFEFYHIDEAHPRYVMPYHWHVEYEIIRVLEGSFTASLEEKEITAGAGDVLFVNSGLLHGGMPHDCLYQCIVFDMNSFFKLSDACKKLIQNIIDHSIVIHHHFPASNVEIHRIVWQLFDSLYQREEGYELMVYGCFYQFFASVYARRLYLTDIRQTSKDYKRIMQLKQVLEFIETSYATAITLEQLSRIAGMSPKYFCRFFHTMTHKTPMDYVNHFRIEHACHQLLATDQPVTEIAFNCGFNDVSYFIRTFKKYKGVTPRQYAKG